MFFSFKMHTIVTFAILLSSSALLASSSPQDFDDRTENTRPDSPFLLTKESYDLLPETSPIVQNTMQSMALLRASKYAEMIQLYESDDILMNADYFQFHLCVADAYQNLAQACQDPIEKAHNLVKGRALMERYSPSGLDQLTHLRYLVIVCCDLFDKENEFFYVNKLIEAAAENVLAVDVRRAFLAALGVGQIEQAHIYWKKILASFLQDPDIDEEVCTLGAHCSYCTRHYDDAITSSVRAMRIGVRNDLVSQNSQLTLLCFIEKGQYGKAAEIIELSMATRPDDGKPANVNSLVKMISLFSKANNHRKATTYLKSLQTHPHMTAALYKMALDAMNMCVKMTNTPLKTVYTRQKTALIKAAKEAFPDDFKSITVSTFDIGRHIRGELLDTYKEEAERLLQDIASVKHQNLAPMKGPIFAAYKTIMGCTPDYVLAPSAAPSSSSSSAPVDSGVTIAQKALSQMRLEKARLIHASQTLQLKARRDAQRLVARDATPVYIQETSAQNLRGEILREHGLPQSSPKPSDGNVDWASPASSSAPVEEDAPFVHPPLSLESLLSTNARETFTHIMGLTHQSVTNKNIKTLIRALFGTGLFEKASYDTKAGHGSHAKIKLWRAGTPNAQRPKPVTLPKHNAAKDYSMEQLKALFEANSLTL